MYYLQPGRLRYFDDMRFKSQTRHYGCCCLMMPEMITVALPLMEKWMTTHRSWSDFVLSTYRTLFEEILEVLDKAFRAMDERLRILLKTTG
jgi:CRP/FNR family transcriptional regulator